MTNIATLLETAIAQALPDNWAAGAGNTFARSVADHQQYPAAQLLPNVEFKQPGSFDRRICCFKTAACCLQK